jgi:hypothetical protein
MKDFSEHFHVALGEQGTNNFILFKFEQMAAAADFFLNISSESFKTFKKTDRVELENNMYKALEHTDVMLYEGGNKYMMVIFGCTSNECMISTLN